MSRLPAEGALWTHMDDLHCIAAADHARAGDASFFAPTAAEALRIARGEQLQREQQET